MSTMEHFRSGLGRVRESVAEGWQHLRHRLGHALIRYHAPTPEVESVGWGLLAAEVKEKRDAVVVRLEAPGLEAGDFDLEVRDQYLVVRGEKRLQREEEREHYHLREMAYGRFERMIPLPLEVDAAGARAKYRNGVLEVILPKRPAPAQRRIEVKSQQ